MAGQNTSSNVRAGTAPPPPLPARPGGARSQYASSIYPRSSQLFSPYGGGLYGGYSPYSMQRPYSLSPYSRFSSYPGYPRGPMTYGESEFVEMAQESVMPAFQSIESIVNAFGSVSMMLDSTYQAVYSSFQAVLGVAEQFSKMKLHISQVFAALSLFRLVKYIRGKLLYLLGMKRTNPGFVESVWRAAGHSNPVNQLPLTEQDLKAPVRWPILIYLGLVFAAPYLIWRLIASITKARGGPNGATDQLKWEEGEGEHYIAKAIHQYSAQQDGDLSFNQGEMMVMAPRHLQPRTRGWLLGSCNGRSGLVPANYIKIIARREGAKRKDDLHHPLRTSNDNHSGGAVHHDPASGQPNIVKSSHQPVIPEGHATRDGDDGHDEMVAAVLEEEDEGEPHHVDGEVVVDAQPPLANSGAGDSTVMTEEEFERYFEDQ